MDYQDSSDFHEDQDGAGKCAHRNNGAGSAGRKFKFLVGPSAESKYFNAKEVEFDGLLVVFADHRETDRKDGWCFVPALVAGDAGSRRHATSVTQVNMLVYDIDGGMTVQEVEDILNANKVKAVAYSTHSHMTTTTNVKVDSYYNWAVRAGQAEDPTSESMAAYLASVKKDRHNITVAPERVHIKGGFHYQLTHDPIAKIRVVFPLDEPIVIANLARTTKEAIETYKSIYFGVAQHFGFVIDTSTSDPSRLYYLPSHPPGRDDWFVMGFHHEDDSVPFMDWTKYQRVAVGKKRVNRDGKLAAKGYEYYLVKDRNGVVIDLKRWAAQKGAEFDIEGTLQSYAPEICGESRANGAGCHIVCPFEDEHTEPGGKGTYCAPGEGDRGFTIFCTHNSCQSEGRDRLDYLREIILKGHLTATDIGYEPPHAPSAWLDSVTSRPIAATTGAEMPCDDVAAVLAELLADVSGTAGPPERLPMKVDRMLTEDERHSGLAFPDTNNKGVPHSTQGNLLFLLERFEIQLAYDEFAEEIIVKGLSGYSRLDDDVVDDLYTVCDANGLSIKKDRLWTFLGTYARMNNVHIPRALFTKLQERWDGVPRLDRVFIDYCGAQDTPYVRAVGAKTFIGAVRRVRKPGCKFDNLPILEGEQGILKSTFWKTMSYGWFTDCLPIGSEPKITIEQTRGVLFAEFAELDGINKKDVETNKAFLSRSEDRARLVWSRKAAVVKRQWIPVGSTNRDRYLRDDANRRYWPVACRGRIDIECLLEARDQLWAEAAVREAQGEPHYLDADLEALAAAEQKQRIDHDDRQDGIADAINGLEGFLPNNELYDFLELPIAKRDRGMSGTVRSVLLANGWKQDSDNVGTGKSRKTVRGWRKGAKDRRNPMVLKYDVVNKCFTPISPQAYTARPQADF